MNKIKIGDDVEIINMSHFVEKEINIFNVSLGDIGKVVGFYKPCTTFAIVKNEKFTCSKAGDGKLYVPVSHLRVIADSEYTLSNRHKLYQAIKKSTVTGQDLSIAMGKNKHYLSSTASQSRFDSRGDISETQLNRLITDIAFAEREVLGLGAKEVKSAELGLSIDKTRKSFKNTGEAMRNFSNAINPDKIKNPLLKSYQEMKKEVDSALDDIISDLNTDGMVEYKKPKTITFPRYYLYIFAVLPILAISLSIYTLTKLA